MMIPTTIAAAILVCTGLGYYADMKLGTAPWGILLGITLGLVTAVRETRKLLGRMNLRDKVKNPKPPGDDAP